MGRLQLICTLGRKSRLQQTFAIDDKGQSRSTRTRLSEDPAKRAFLFQSFRLERILHASVQSFWTLIPIRGNPSCHCYRVRYEPTPEMTALIRTPFKARSSDKSIVSQDMLQNGVRPECLGRNFLYFGNMHREWNRTNDQT